MRPGFLAQIFFFGVDQPFRLCRRCLPSRRRWSPSLQQSTRKDLQMMVSLLLDGKLTGRTRCSAVEATKIRLKQICLSVRKLREIIQQGTTFTISCFHPYWRGIHPLEICANISVHLSVRSVEIRTLQTVISQNIKNPTPKANVSHVPLKVAILCALENTISKSTKLCILKIPTKFSPLSPTSLTTQCTDFPPCTASFRKKNLLRAHISDEHTHSPPFPCPHADEGCTAAFTLPSKLNLHLQKRHTKRYFCDDCPESFILLLDLQRHRRDEHKPRCFTCDMEFATKDVLLHHLSTHRTSLEERKKFACEYEGCAKRYTKV